MTGCSPVLRACGAAAAYLNTLLVRTQNFPIRDDQLSLFFQ